MDSATLDLIKLAVLQIIEEKFDYKFWAITVSLLLIAIFFLSWVTSYATQRGIIKANNVGFENLKRQISEQTVITETIKFNTSHQDWSLKEYKTIKRQKLERFLELTEILMSELLEARSTVCFTDNNLSLSTSQPSLKMLQVLYFPELLESYKAFNEIYHKMNISIFEAQQFFGEIKRERRSELIPAMRAFNDRFNEDHGRILAASNKIYSEAQVLMQSLIKVKSDQ